MKKLFFITMAALMAVTMVNAEKAVLLDFNLLTADDGAKNNVATTIDVSRFTTYDLSATNRPELKTSLAIQRWDIELARSARYALNENKSFVKEVVSKTAEGQKTVIGVRVLFPKSQINSYAEIRPEFDIPIWAERDGSYIFREGYGAVMNVGVLKKVKIRVCGRNYTHSIQLLVETKNKVVKVIDFGPLDFVGWRTLEWANPNVITSIHDRKWVNNPIYPGNMPYLKVVGIRFIKDIRTTDGDFIAYIDKIEIEYDKAYIETEFDIDDEEVWGIQAEWQSEVEKNEYKVIGRNQTKVFLESQKIDEDTNADPTN